MFIVFVNIIILHLCCIFPVSDLSFATLNAHRDMSKVESEAKENVRTSQFSWQTVS